MKINNGRNPLFNQSTNFDDNPSVKDLSSTQVSPQKDSFELLKTKASTWLSEEQSTPLAQIRSLFNDEIVTYKNLGGGDNSVFLINDRWIFRVPKFASAAKANRHEQVLLRELHSLVKTTQIPVYKIWDSQHAIGAYQEIPGLGLSAQLYTQMSAKAKLTLAHDLARSLSEIHSLPREKVAFLPNAVDEAKAYIAMARSSLATPSIFSQEEVQIIAKALAIAEAKLAKPQAALKVIHGDLHGDNILVDHHAQCLSGIIDFSDARIGFAIIDFLNLYRISFDLAETTAEIYAQAMKIDAKAFIEECRAWSIVWQAAGIAKNYQGSTLREQKRVIRSGRALGVLFSKMGNKS